MNDQLIIDIQNRIREVDSIDELFEEIETELYEDKPEDFHRL